MSIYPSRRYARQEPSSDEDEEPEAPPAKRRASAAGGRAPTGGGDESDDSELDDGYGSDLYKNDEDREALEMLTELEREMILSQRGEDRDAALERRRNAKMLKLAQQAASGQASAHAAAHDCGIVRLSNSASDIRPSQCRRALGSSITLYTLVSQFSTLVSQRVEQKLVQA